MGAKPLTTVSTAQTVLPEWYTNQAQDLLASQNALLNRPYQAFDGARLAELTPDQLAGINLAGESATGYQPILQGALSTLNNAIPNYDEVLARIRAANPDYTGATGALDTASASAGRIGGVSGSALSSAQPWFNQAGSMSAYDAASPTLGGALQYSQASTSPLAIAMAQPYLDKAAGDVTDVSAYMNPYDDAVVKRIGDIGARTLREQLAPAINDKFIRSGQLMSSGQSIDEARALRDVAADVTAKQAELLQQGYTSAQAAKGSDLSRYGSLAGTAGNLGLGQQGALSTAAGQIADIGKTYGALTSADQNALLDIGKSSGTLAGQDDQLRLAAMQAQANAELQAAQQRAALTGQQQTGALNQAKLQGDILGQQQAGALTQAQQAAALAAQTQNQQIAGANALTTAGGLTQGQNQKSLDIQYGDFLRQQGYPQAQIDAMLKTFQGVQGGVPQGSVGFEQKTKTGSSPSLASTILGLAAGAKGVGVI